MRNSLALLAARLVFLALVLSPLGSWAGGYTNLSIAVYFRYQEVQSTPDRLPQFSNSWAKVEKQVKVDKVYLETTRNGELATATAVTAMKQFFQDRGIKASGGLGLTANEANGFQSYCYSTPADREKVKAMTEFTARHFDEIILDDFFFTNCKCDRCIAAKGDQSWTKFRTEQLDRVSEELIIAPARAVNPKVRIVIKYPNWYEGFQGAGYDLAVEPRLYDAIYTGTETRDANSGQRLQPYQSFLQTQYFNNIKPGGNQGGWIDGGWDVERYAEQMWDTFFARVPEITLFNSQQIMGRLNTNRMFAADASLSMARLTAPIPQPDGSHYTPDMVARIAGCSAELLDRFLGKLGKPIGLATYKPCNSVGEPYLPNYLGMLGIPIDLVPEFPSHAPAMLLTAASAYDRDLVAKTKKFVQAGGRVIATTGLLEALGEDGFQDISEVQVSARRVMAMGFPSGARSGGALATNEAAVNILLPQIRRFENDNRLTINFNTALSGYPMAVSCAYGKGTFCVLAIPDDFADLYRLPQHVLNQIRQLLGRDLFVTLDAPDHVSLFAYDNRTFIVQNFQAKPVSARVPAMRATTLRDLLSDETLAGTPGGGNKSGRALFGTGSTWFDDLACLRVFSVE